MHPQTPPPNRIQAGIRPTPYRLPPTTRLGRVLLAVSNLERSVDFYTNVIGLSLLSETTTGQHRVAHLGIKGAPQVLLQLQQTPGVQPIHRRTRLGLYHTAFLLPTREALAAFIHHLQTRGIPFGSADHLVSEALYLTDPDGLTVEVYADRPSDQWTVEDRELLLGVLPLTLPLTLDDPMPPTPQAKGLQSGTGTSGTRTSGSWTGAPLGTTLGHLHFYIGDLQQAKNFYHHALGLAVSQWVYTEATPPFVVFSQRKPLLATFMRPP